jgi:lipoprotein-releasing system permease protein
MGVALLIMVLSVMNGFDRELKNTILSVVPHIQLEHQIGLNEWKSDRNKILEIDQVTQAVPYNSVEGLIIHRSISRPVQILGLVEDSIPDGLEVIIQRQGLRLPSGDGILLSQAVADALNVRTNQRVSIVVSGDTNTPAAVHSLEVNGVFATHTELDQYIALASLSEVGRILGNPTKVQGFRLQIKDQFDARNVGFSIIRDLPPGYGFRDWFQTHGNLYKAIQLSRNIVGLIIFLVVAIAAFNVVSMLMMTVMNKRKDIAILQTLGLTRIHIIALFLTQGSMIGFVGISFGVLLGVLGCYWVSDFVVLLESSLGTTLLNTEVYPIDYIPVDLRWDSVAIVVATALVLNLVATIYPAFRASKTNPADELRYE